MTELTIYRADEELVLTEEASKEIQKLELAIKELKKREDEIKATLLEEMTEGDVIKIEDDNLIVTKVDSYDCEKFDSKAFRKDHPDLYDEYIRISTVKPSIRIKVKE